MTSGRQPKPVAQGTRARPQGPRARPWRGLNGLAFKAGRALRTHPAVLLTLAALAAGASLPARADPPARVVSINVCTDQLAMMLAAPGQLASVSHLATDPRVSAMTGEAARYPANRARAEEIFLMKPDLVLAGAYTSQATVEMLQRLGIRVEVFQPASSLDDVEARIAKMGRALGRDAEADALAGAFRTQLRILRTEIETRPRAALYYANGYTSGDRTLAGQILAAAGFENIAAEAGFAGGGVMPLEVLALAAPDAIITGETYPGGSRAEEILTHPVVESLRRTGADARVESRYWLCGTPHVLTAIETLGATRRTLTEGGE